MTQQLPLKGIRVIEFEGLAPSIFAGLLLADFGAEVIIINRKEKNHISPDVHETTLNRNKKSIVLDLKSENDILLLKKLIAISDIIIDSYRPGVLEKLHLGPQDCWKINQKIVFARISSFGQNSDYTQKGGHDINFLALSGVLQLIASQGGSKIPAIPANIIGDFGAGGALSVVGILAAYIQAQKTQKGQLVDMGMTQASSYLASFIFNYKRLGIWSNEPGTNTLDGGAHFYTVYECSDGKFMSVGCIETKFYEDWVQGLDFDLQYKTYLLENQFNKSEWDEMKRTIQVAFKKKTRDEWVQRYKDLDACCFPVYSSEEMKGQINNRLGNILIDCGQNPNDFEVQVQPRLSGMELQKKQSILPKRGQHNSEIEKLINEKPKL